MGKMLQRRLAGCMGILVLFSLLLVPTYAIEGLSSHPVYEGVSDPIERYNETQFNDIDNHWAREAIQEAAAFALMSGVDNQRFQPDGILSYADALTVIVKAIGQEGEAQQLGENQAPADVRNLSLLSTADHWIQGTIQVAIENGIVTPEEAGEISNLTPNQLETIGEQIEDQLDNYNEGNYTAQELAAIEQQIRQKLEINSTWNQPTTRQQVGQWIARALKLDPVYGDKMTKVRQFKDWENIDTEKVPFIEAMLQGNYMSGTSGTTFVPRGQLTRGQMAQIITKAHDDMMDARGITKYTGDITAVETVQQDQQDVTLFTIRKQDQSHHVLSAVAGSHDFIVKKDGTMGLSNRLRRGDVLRYYINEENKVLYGVVEPLQSREIEGFVELVNSESRQLMVTDFADQRHVLQVAPNADITVNQRASSLNNILYGQEVVVTVKGNNVTKIEAFLEEDPDRHGYIPPESRIKVGDILFIDENEVEIRVDNQREKYRIVNGTQVLRNDQRANLFEVKVGDRVILTFDDIYSPDISSIRVEDHERHIDGIYRGRLEQVNPRGNEIVLGSLVRYENGRWQSVRDTQMKLRVDNGNLYQGPSQTDLTGLSRFRGSEVYVAVENSYGTPGVAKLLTKDGSTLYYDSQISDVEFATNRMVVDGHSMGFHPGTIVVQNNRLVDVLNLDRGQTIHLAGDLNRGGRDAAFVSIEGSSIIDDRIDSSRIVVYRGNIEDIGHYGVTIGRLGYQLNYLQLENHRWQEVGRREKFTLTEDSFIFDSELELEIDSSHFIDSRFIDPQDIEDDELRRRVEDDFYFDKSAYFVVRERTYGDTVDREVLALNITPHVIYDRGSVQTEHSATASIEGVDLDQGQITLGNVRNWNGLNNRWERSQGQQEIDIHKTVILLNDRPISQEEVYLLRSGAQAYLIKNKNVSTQDDAYILIVEQ
ncbi:S-layer domain protein [Alkaliphilus metalliredigens QYMF]|uniref:S-layer domain protein n=1 Tax=Alkaliphilus metalliredigens (strain QYMF) TaxID=293826 RepID=A6TJQ0_ALKMQ|nr:S-layer homology domain-containing protein [Alkaliphilus metalliredigens]ABR46418.1 S-layer domain protein [Alkaliphilus metalliredigens QYMF]